MPLELAHSTVLGSAGVLGCGAVFGSIYTDYQDLEVMVKSIRPELPYRRDDPGSG